MLKLICLLLEEIPQHPIYEHLGKSPTYKEIKRAIKSMTNDKAPGDSGMTTDMIKNLPPKALLFSLLNSYVNSGKMMKLTLTHGTQPSSQQFTRAKVTTKTLTTTEGSA